MLRRNLRVLQASAFAASIAISALPGVAAADEPEQLPPPPPPYGQPPPPYGQPAPPYGQPAGGRYYGQGGPYGGQEYQAPKYLDYEEGEEIPPGYHLESRANRGLVIGGSVMLGTGWLVSVFTGLIGEVIHQSTGFSGTDGQKNTWMPMLIPVAGPFVTMFTARQDISDSGYVPIILLGAVQAGGLAMLISGAVVKSQRLVRIANTELQIDPIFAPRTAQSGGFTGLSLSGKF